MEYQDANYIDKSVIVSGTFLVKNRFDDKEKELTDQYRNSFKEWQKEWVGDKELKKMFNDKIKEHENENWEEENYRNSVYQNTEYTEEDKIWAMERSKKRSEVISRMVKRFTYYKNKCLGKEMKAELNVELAKEFPIGDMFPRTDLTIRQGNKEFFLCPLSPEKTPSFCWYRKTNTWHCFSCGESGDSIALHMKLNNCDFVTAVKKLC